MERVREGGGGWKRGLERVRMWERARESVGEGGRGWERIRESGRG